MRMQSNSLAFMGWGIMSQTCAFKTSHRKELDAAISFNAFVPFADGDF